MIVVPESRGGPIVVIDVVATAAGDVPVFREAVVFRAIVSAVKVCDGADFGVGCIEHVVEGTIECGIDGQEVFLGQSISEANSRGDTALSFNGGTGIAAVVAPYSGHGQSAVQAGLELRHGNGGGCFGVGPDDGGQRQRIDIFGKSGGIDRHWQCGSAGGLR